MPSANSTGPPPQLPERKRRDGRVHVELECPQCAHPARLPIAYAGRRVRCPHCKTRFRLAADASRLISSVGQLPAAPPRQSADIPEPPEIPSRGKKSRPRNSPASPGRSSVRDASLTSVTETEDGNRTARPTSSGNWKWLVPCWVLGLALTGSLAFYLISRATAADVVDDADPTVWESPNQKPPVGPAGERQAAAKAKPKHQAEQKADPPKPADKLAERLVQRKEFNADRLKGLTVALPAAVMKKQATLNPGKTTLIAVLQQLAVQHRVPMLIDEQALSDEGIPLNWPVTIDQPDQPNQSLDEALTAVLSPLLLKHLVPGPDAEAIVITSEIKAANTDATKLLRRGTVVAGNTVPKRTPPTSTRKPASRPKPKPSRSNSPTNALRRGRQLFTQRKYNEAIAEFNQAIKLRPRFPEAYFGRGRARLYKGDNRQAAVDFTTAIRLRRNYADAYASRAIANARLGLSRSARQDRVRAAQLRKKK